MKSLFTVPEYITLNQLGPEINVATRISKRARKIAIRIQDQHAEIVLPRLNSLNQATEFLYKKEDWIRKKLANRSEKPSIQPLEDGAILPILGTHITLKSTPNKVVLPTYKGNELWVPGATQNIAQKTSLFIAKELLNYVEQRYYQLQEKLNISAKQLTIRPTKTRHGSCSSDKKISINLYLAFAPLKTIDYVIAHEMAHLKEMNHSKQFWQLVEELMPDYQEHKTWLKQHGYQLYQYQCVSCSMRKELQ